MSIDVDIRIDTPFEDDVDRASLSRGIRVAADSRGFIDGRIELWITTDPRIHRINREHLDHDYPTDVISFGYLAENGRIEGEMVVSRDTAERQAAELGVPPEEELLRYVVHGTLHIAGMDDADAVQRDRMRDAEDQVIRKVLGMIRDVDGGCGPRESEPMLAPESES